MNPQEAEIEGVVDSIVFYNEENHFCIARLIVKGTREKLTIRGTLVQLKEGETIRASGRYMEDPRFGHQFQVQYFQAISPKTEKGIEKVLGSGLIPGVGPKMAERIVRKFGAETFEVIENQPERLAEVEGIGRHRVDSIVSSWVEQKAARDVLIYLRGRGLGEAHAMKIYKIYGSDSLARIQRDPYLLCREVNGIGFKTADQLALEMGYGEDSLERIRAGLLHTLREMTSDGHTCIEKELLLQRMAELLPIERERLEIALEHSVDEEDLVLRESLVIERIMDKVEQAVAMRVATLLMMEREGFKTNIQLDHASLDLVRQEFPEIILSTEQINALKMAGSHSCSVITGGPGVGKTTLLKLLVHLFRKARCKIRLCAPTGKAARRMEMATGHVAGTLHRLLQYKGGDEYGANEENPLDGEVFILDEASMLDIWLFHAFLKALPTDATLILVGDVDQLPSVGPGHVLRDLILSGHVPVARLKQIFRQKGGSGIVDAAHKVNSGQWFGENHEGDFYFIDADQPQKVQDFLKRLLIERIPRRFGWNPILDCQVLAPMYRGDAGIDALNRMLQDLLNPNEEDLEVGNRIFRAGDKVMQLENNYEKEVFNGDQGLIESIHYKEGRILVRFDEERLVEYSRKELDELTLCYAASVHKVQGSEFPCIVFILMNSHWNMLRRNLLYTGLTRGKSLVLLLGQRQAFERAIREKDSVERRTLLRERLSQILADLEI